MEQSRSRILLVRHGETEANRLRRFGTDNVCLTELGRAQALELARRLRREFRPHCLVSSEFLRARQTSEIVSQSLGLPTETVKGIHERDFGRLKGKPYEQLGALMSVESPGTEPWLWRAPGGESLDDVRLRAIDAIEALRLRYPDQEIVVVCHGAVIQAVCAHITGVWSEGAVPQNCGIVAIGYGPDGWESPFMPDCWENLTPRQTDGTHT